MLRRAIVSQMEMGVNEIVVKQPKAEMTIKPQVDIVPASEQTVQAVSVAQAIAPGMIAPAQFDSVDSHCQAISNCQKCSLGATRNKFVYGVGNPKADLMFVGEAPGANEDRLGEPFVGQCGQLLDKIMAAIQFDRQTVYIANILKCRPPANRDPQPDEMDQCFPYLHEQIRLVKPKLICALGRVAAQAILQTTTPLGKLRGQWHLFENVPLLVTYHPAALLRFQSYKRDTWEDMKMLKAKYDSLI